MTSFDMLSHTICVDGTIMYKNFLNYQETILNMQVHDDDIWVCTFPKSGTTWTQEMVWLLVNNLDYVGAERNLNERFPFLEMSGINPILNMPQQPESYVQVPHCKNSVRYVEELERPRLIKTHLAWNFLPLQIQMGHKKPKIIYVIRNPKDVCVSYYHHTRIFDGVKVTLDEFCEFFLRGKILYCQYWDNIFSYWNKRNEDNILFLKYEDMKSNLPLVINKVARFLGKQLTEKEVDKLSAHLSFESMKNNNSVNNSEIVEIFKKFKLTSFSGDFLRTGTVGSHKSVMSEKTIERFDIWIEQNTAGTDLNFNSKN